MKALQLTKPHILTVVGGPASGKTAFATKFSDTFNAPYIDAKKFLSVSQDPTSALPLVFEVLKQLQKTNQTIVYEGFSGTRAERLQIAKLCRDNGYDQLLVWVQTDPSVAYGRATKRSRSNPEPMSDEDFEREQKRFTPPSPQEKAVVISGMHTPASQTKAVLKRLAELRQQILEKRDETSTRPPRRPVIIQ